MRKELEYVQIPPNEAPITELWAWLSIDDKGNEGIVAFELSNKTWMSVTSKRRIAEKMRPFVQEVVERSGLRVRLVKFTTKEVVEEN